MKPMDKIRKIAIRKFANKSYSQIGAELGFTKNSIWNFLAKQKEAPFIAKAMAEKCGGECKKAYDLYVAEREAVKAENARLRKRRKYQKYKDSKSTRYLAPSCYVPMPAPTPETHHLTDPGTLSPRLQLFCGYLA